MGMLTKVSKQKMKGDQVTMKEKLKKMKQNIAASICGGIALASNMVTNCYASEGGVDSITAPLVAIKTLVVSVIAAVGVIILAKNVMEFAQAYQQQDTSTMNSALKGIVAGVLMAGISTVLGFLGF